MKNYFIIFLVIAIVLAAFSFSQIIFAIAGWPYLMVTMGESMIPVLEPNYLIIMSPVHASEVEVGMIVAVDHRGEHLFPFGSYIVHRVESIKEKDGELFVRTKGDNNKLRDERVPISDVKTKLIYAIPFVGLILTPPVSVMIILGFLYMAFRSYRKKIIK